MTSSRDYSWMPDILLCDFWKAELWRHLRVGQRDSQVASVFVIDWMPIDTLKWLCWEVTTLLAGHCSPMVLMFMEGMFVFWVCLPAKWKSSCRKKISDISVPHCPVFSGYHSRYKFVRYAGYIKILDFLILENDIRSWPLSLADLEVDFYPFFLSVSPPSLFPPSCCPRLLSLQPLVLPSQRQWQRPRRRGSWRRLSLSAQYQIRQH